MCCPFCSVSVMEKVLVLKGKFRLVVKEEGVVQLQHEDEVFLPEVPNPIVWRYVFDNDRFRKEKATIHTYFIGARIVAVQPGSVELTVSVRDEKSGYTSHSVRFVRKAVTT